MHLCAGSNNSGKKVFYKVFTVCDAYTVNLLILATFLFTDFHILWGYIDIVAI